LKLILDLIKSKATPDLDDVSGSLGAVDLKEKGKSEYKNGHLEYRENTCE
jgi:hypothetical protein